MRVAEVEHISACGIEERGGERIEALGPADHRRLPADGKTGERLQRGFDRALAAANQRYGEEIHQRALGLMHDGRIERVPLRLGDELRQSLRHIRIIWRIVWHLTPRAGQ